MDGSFECTFVRPDEWRVGKTGIAICRDHCPAIEVVFARERQVHGLLSAFAGYVNAAHVVEDAVDLRIFPELVDRDQGVRE